MANSTVSQQQIARLEEERQRADRAYNEALTAVDRAVGRPAFQPALPPGPDDARLPELNASWEIIGPTPVTTGGWRGRLAGLIWRVLAPVFQRQQAFNAAVVDHMNRSHARASEGRDAIATLAAAVGGELAALASFQSRLILYLQQVTPYADTKDRHEAGVLRHLIEHRTAGLAAGLDAVGDELLKRWEAAVARERRFDARVEDLRRSMADFRRVAGAADSAVSRRLPAAANAGMGAAPVGVERDQLAAPAHSATYAGFEDHFRGSTEDIAARLGEYLPLFAGSSDVLDLGCGRGEFLELLNANGIPARGVDLNPEMVRRCRELGLQVTEGDALEHLASLDDGSLGGVFAAQVIEHLPPDRLLQLLALAHRKLRPGGRMVLETINPACWYAFFSSYILDLTHVRPVHPETLRYLLTAGGFEDVDIRFSSPYPKAHKLQPVPLSILGHAPDLAELVEAFNGNVEKVNALLFTNLDFAGVGTRPATSPLA